MRVITTNSRFSLLSIIAAAAALLVTLPLSAGEAAAPTPTPVPTLDSGPRRPQRLGDIAAGIELDISRIGIENGLAVITNDSLEQGPPSTAGGSAASSGSSGQQQEELSRMLGEQAQDKEKNRLYWRKRYQTQKQRVAKVRGELAVLDVKISNLEDTLLRTGNALRRETVIRPKLEEAKEKRRVTAARLASEEAALSSLIRQARRDGAEPGWFR